LIDGVDFPLNLILAFQLYQCLFIWPLTREQSNASPPS